MIHFKKLPVIRALLSASGQTSLFATQDGSSTLAQVNGDVGQRRRREDEADRCSNLILEI